MSNVIRNDTDYQPVTQAMPGVIEDKIRQGMGPVFAAMEKSEFFHGANEEAIKNYVDPIKVNLQAQVDAMLGSHSLDEFRIRREAFDKALDQVLGAYDKDNQRFTLKTKNPHVPALLYFMLDTSYLYQPEDREIAAVTWETVMLRYNEFCRAVDLDADPTLNTACNAFQRMMTTRNKDEFLAAKMDLLQHIESHDAYVQPDTFAMHKAVGHLHRLSQQLDDNIQQRLSPLKKMQHQWKPFAWIGIGVALLIPSVILTVLAPGAAVAGAALGFTGLGYSFFDFGKETRERITHQPKMIYQDGKLQPSKPSLATRIRRIGFYSASGLSLAAGIIGVAAVFATAVFPPAVPIAMAVVGLSISAVFVGNLIRKAIKAKQKIQTATKEVSETTVSLTSIIDKHKEAPHRENKYRLSDAVAFEKLHVNVDDAEARLTALLDKHEDQSVEKKQEAAPSSPIPKPQPSDQQKKNEEEDEEGDVRGPEPPHPN